MSSGNPITGLANGIARSVSAASVDELSSGRIVIWTDTWQRLAGGFGLWFGWGGNGYIRMGLARGFIFHPHNVILQVLTDWGIVGFILLVNFLANALRPLAGARFRTANGALAVSILVFLLITGMLDGGLYHPQFLVCAGLAFAMLFAGMERKPAANQLTLRLAPAALLLVTTMVHLSKL